MSKRLTIIGAGPIGIEAATLAVQRGWDVTVFEAGKVGENIARWEHVRFFSPWGMNRSPWGYAALEGDGLPLEPEDEFPTGEIYRDAYLKPLADRLGARLREGTRVLGISKRDMLKGEEIGTGERAESPFLIHTNDGEVESYSYADVVFDTTGVYAEPSRLGPGGLSALGEGDNEERIERYIPDALDTAHQEYAGKHVLLVGSGHSAVTSLRLLHALRQEAPDTFISWVLREKRPPYRRFVDDPLPERDELAVFGNDAAAGKIEGIAPYAGYTVWGLFSDEAGTINVTLQGDDTREIHVDRIVSNVGYRPSRDLNRELQMHHCYASEGPMKLAASLLAANGGGGDCLQQESTGVDILLNPEPNFFVLGHKSYGRNSAFLLKIGFDQIREVLDHLEAAQ